MKVETTSFTFKIPEGHESAGTKITKSFKHDVVETSDEAIAVMTEKKWNLAEMVSDLLKANARSSAYQSALLPYKPSEKSPAEISERLVRDYIRMGFSESVARAQVSSMLAQLQNAEATEEV